MRTRLVRAPWISGVLRRCMSIGGGEGAFRWRTSKRDLRNYGNKGCCRDGHAGWKKDVVRWKMEELSLRLFIIRVNIKTFIINMLQIWDI